MVNILSCQSRLKSAFAFANSCHFFGENEMQSDDDSDESCAYCCTYKDGNCSRCLDSVCNNHSITDDGDVFCLECVDRYLYIQSALNFSSDSEACSTDRIWKIRKFMDMMNARFTANYSLSQRISIDESLLLWKGHHSLRR